MKFFYIFLIVSNLSEAMDEKSYIASSLSETIQEILDNSREIKIDKHAHSIAKSHVTYHKKHFLPDLSIESSYHEKIEENNDKSLNYRISMSQKIFDYGVIKGIDKSKSELIHSSLKNRLKSHRIILDATSDYMAITFTDIKISILNKKIAYLDKIKKIIERNFHNGNATKADINDIDSSIENTKNTIYRLKNNHFNLRNSFFSAYSVRIHNPIQPTIAFNSGDQPLLTEQQYIAKAKSHSLDILVNMNEIKSAKIEKCITDANLLPTFQAEISFNNDNLAQSDQLEGRVSIKMPLDIGLKNKYKSYNDALVIKQRIERMKETEERVSNEISTALNNINYSIKYNKLLVEQIAKTEKNINRKLKLFNSGILNSSDLTPTIDLLYDKKIERFYNYFNHWINRFTLQYHSDQLDMKTIKTLTKAMKL